MWVCSSSHYTIPVIDWMSAQGVSCPHLRSAGMDWGYYEIWLATRWGSLTAVGLHNIVSILFIFIKSTSCLCGSFLLFVVPMCLELKKVTDKNGFSLLNILTHAHTDTHTHCEWFLPLLLCFLRCGHFLMQRSIFPTICSRRPHHKIKQASP